MLPDEKESLVEIENDEPELQQDSVSQVTIDLEKKPEIKEKELKPAVQSKPSDDITKLHNTIAYQTRKLDQALRELQEVKGHIATSRQNTTQKESQDLDEVDRIAQTDWKQGVKKVVEPEIEKRVEEILKKREEAQAELTRRNSLTSELNKSKERVISRYPMIEDETSEEASLYRQVINEDSSLLSNVYGPEIAMYRMEERMRQMGKTPAMLKPVIDREVSRLTRAGASSVIGKTTNTSSKPTITREQKEFCDRYNIPYEKYLRNLKASANGGTE